MSTYSPSLRIELITTGDQPGGWGNTTNTNLGTIIESSIAGYIAVSITSANQALTAIDGAADQARNMVIGLTTTTTAAFAVYAPPAEKMYIIYNASAYSATIYNSTVTGNTTAAGLGVVIPAGKTVPIWSDGTNFAVATNYAPQWDVGGNLTVGGASTVNSNQTVEASQTVGGSSVVNGNSTMRGALSLQGTAYLNRSGTQTIAQVTAINTSTSAITLATAAYTDGTAIQLSTSGTMPTGLSVNTVYYVVNTSATSYFSGSGVISGTTLTIFSVYAGSIGVGTVITGSGITTATVTSLGTGIGQTGTYNINVSQTAASTTVSGTYSGAQTLKLSASLGGSAVSISATGTGNMTLYPVALGITAPAGSTTSALATSSFVTTAVSNALSSVPFTATNWAGSETFATQTATITIASPAVISVTTAPANGTAVSFSTTGALPTGITANAAYYVINRTSNTYQIATSVGGTAINTSGTQSGVQTETTSTLNFKYKTLDKMSVDLGGNLTVTGGVTSGAGALVPTSAGGTNGSVFTASGTFTVPASITAVKVTVIGGGGNGGTATGGYNAGGGGGAGGTAIKYITGLTPGAAIAVTVGAAAGTSSFGAYCSATGGANAATASGSYAAPAGGAGGTATGGNINLTGGAGSAGVSDNLSIIVSGAGGGTNASAVSGNRVYDSSSLTYSISAYPTQGAGMFGSGGAFVIVSSSGLNGNSGNGYGNGGSGGASWTSSTNTGGAGADGIVIVEW